jgi:cAMP-dependent protein kinase regulator
MYENFLASVPILASLEAHARAKVADALESKTYQPGETIISEGEPGDEFFLVESGVAIVEKSGSGVIGELSRGDYFGGMSLMVAWMVISISHGCAIELALLNRAPRAATVKASEQESSKLRLAALGEKAFTRLLGPVREIMARKAGEMYGTGGLYKS